MRSALPLAAGLLLAAGAWGQTVTMTQTKGGNLTLASEFFGAPEGREVLFTMPDFPNFVSPATSQPYIRLLIEDDPDATGTGSLGTNNTTMITFTLSGATFAASAGGTNLRYFVGGALGDDFSVTVASDGNRGDRTVTYEVETTGNIDPTGDAKALYFFPPALQVSPIVLNPAETNPANQIRGATVVASIDGRNARSSSNPFPRSLLGSGTDRSTSASIVNAVADGEILRLAPALTASLGTPGQATVDIENRKALADGLTVRMSGSQERTFGLKVGELSIRLTPEDSAPRVLRSADLTNDGGALDSALGGTADLTVTGPFQDGDLVLLGADRTSDSSKRFDMASGGGPATLSVPIAAMAAMDLVYVPGGVMDLRPGEFRASLALDFNDDRNADGVVGTTIGMIKYRGVTTQAYAHGVSRANDAAVTSFLRLTCAGLTPPATGCNVFLSCNGEDGADYFGDLTGADVIPSGGTGVYSSGSIASALGGGWSQGAGRCDLLSNGTLEVQHLIRTSGLAEHNNTVVVGRTRTHRIGLLRARPILDLGGSPLYALVSLGPAAPQGSLYLLSDGRFYGTRAAIDHIADQWGRPQSTRLNAPPSSSGGGFQPMDHEPGCAFFEWDIRITPTNCLHDDAPELMGATLLMSGDLILQQNRGVLRRTNGRWDVVRWLTATSTGFVLSR